ncbi:hypothetical protein H310_01660 [Aphanomyces invadans]|uniref:Uncharacterized protein n=1 Tax=Aphanomyces invadans TaxID=157072 RepID=A0A024US09_9STRA|nr:hypothetical protein H310_01660 [Aphanomyces invadans]ETW09261.1 hypothetical protein H310_01660 [Aphanomyces invadans]|eukprot:XP_008863066.1 hypothetical protein H310_01660 [Aphanomyces invadans]
MKENLKAACTDYAGQVFERNHVTQALEERIALAMYKIDEASALVDAHVDLEMDDETRESIALLLHRSELLQRQFRAIDHMERIVDAMAASTKQIQERMEAVQKHAEPILNPTQISAMLKRTLALGRKKASSSGDTSAVNTIAWEPVTFIPSTSTCMKRLDEIMAHRPDEIAAAYTTPSISSTEIDKAV